MTKTVTRILLLAAVFAVMLSICGCPLLFGRKASLGTPSDFAYTTFAGENGQLSGLYGQPLVLNFWAAWCGPCIGEFPEFQEVFSAHAGQFRMLSVAVDENNDPRALVSEKGYNWTFATTTEDVLTMYGIKGIPMTLFITRDGRIADTVVGGMDRATFEQKLAKIL